MTYLDVPNKRIQYEEEEGLIEMEETIKEIEALSLEEVQDLIKERVSELTDFRNNYQ